MAQIEYNKQKPLSKKMIVGGLLFAFLLTTASILLLLYPFASKEKVKYFEGDHPILFNGKQAGNALMEGKSVFVPVSFLQTFIDDSIVFDEKSNSIILTTKDKVIQMPTESLTYYVNEKPVQLHISPLKDQQGDLYIAIDPILVYYPMTYSILPKSGAILINQDGDKINHATIINQKVNEEKLRLRTNPDIRSPYVAQTTYKEKITIEGHKKDYYFVRKQDGTAGFIKKDLVQKENSETIIVQLESKLADLPKIDGPIQLTWEAVYTLNPDTDKIPEMPGINVVSPTWFELDDIGGAINNIGSLDYVKWAKKKGYHVWGVYSNAFDPELTHEAFKHFETRQKMIRQLLHYSQMYKLDGINLDIENVNPEDGPLITQFVREAAPYFHEAGLIVSMDITFIADGNYSAFLEREKLAKIVDYLMVMAYDEHWGSSPVAGSVSSIPWVEENLQRLLEQVPNEKLILGVPLYTRLWEVKDSGEVSSKALSMSQVKEWLKKNKVKPTYDPATGQNYAEFYHEKEKVTYKIWLEDELSLQKRTDIANEHELAGIATWSRFFANETAWTALNLNNKQITKKD